MLTGDELARQMHDIDSLGPRWVAGSATSPTTWAKAIQARSSNNVAAVALAAKHARIIWAMLAKDSNYRCAKPAQA